MNGQYRETKKGSDVTAARVRQSAFHPESLEG